MKTYPSIQGASKAPKGKSGYGFYKYDGSNLRFEWSPKRGFYKYGARTRLFDHTDSQFGEAVELFHDNYASFLEPIIKKYKTDKATVYMEFWGENSFAGTHANEEHNLTLFDVHINRKGILSPKEFIKEFGDLDFSAKIVYTGNFNQNLIDNVRKNTLESIILNEGIVFKGGEGHNLWMTKVKTLAYLDKLKKVYSNNWQDYWE